MASTGLILEEYAGFQETGERGSGQCALELTSSAVCFGDCRNSTGTLGTDQLYTGQRLDGTGLYFYNARYYDSSIGRFISPDNVTPNYSNPQDLNRYSYVHNNPLTYNDPTGHFLHFLTAAVTGAFVSAMAYTAVTVGVTMARNVSQMGVAGAFLQGLKALNARDFAEAAVIGGLTAGVGTVGVVTSAIEKLAQMPATVVLNAAGGLLTHEVDLALGKTTDSPAGLVGDVLFSSLPSVGEFHLPDNIQNDAFASAGIGIADTATSSIAQLLTSPSQPSGNTQASYNYDDWWPGF